MGKDDIEVMSWEKVLNRHLLFRDASYNDVPFGPFCYEDITPSLRYYCKYINDNRCGLMGKKPIHDLVKICDVNFSWENKK